MHEHNEVRQLAATGNLRHICPWCGGGKSKEKSFTVTEKDGMLKYNCFRAKCRGSRGILPVNPLNEDKKVAAPVKKELKDDKDHIKQLPANKQYYFQTIFELEPEATDDWYWSTTSNKVIIPLYSTEGDTIGHLQKHYPVLDPTKSPSTETSSRTYWRDDTEEPHLHFPYPVLKPDELVLVEDVISAIRMSTVGKIDSAALLGTHITEDTIAKLKTKGFKHIIILLDADATARAIKLKEKMELSFQSVVIKPLEGPDIKDLSDTEIQTIAKECIEQL